jgi:transposase
MTFNPENAKIFIRPGRTDLRKAVNGLAAIIENEMKEAPFSGSAFLFCNRTGKLLKVIWWDRTGFWLCQKKLEKEKFPWPADEKAAMEITKEELFMLLAGIDFFKAHKPLYFSKIT